MNTLRKMFSIVTAVMLAGTVLTSCGSGSDVVDAAKTDELTTGDAEALENEKSNVITIGCSGPMTGSAAQYGTGVKNAIDLAVKEVNESGKLGDIKLEAIFEDDGADSGEKAVQAYQTLKSNGMDIMIGTVTSGSCLAISDQVRSDNMFLLTPSASSPDVIKNDNCFQVCFSDPNQGKASADYIADHALGSKVAVLYNSEDAYSSGIYERFKSEAEMKALSIVYEGAFTDPSSFDFASLVQSAKDSEADLVFLPTYYQEAANIIMDASEIEYKPVFFGCDGLDGILNVECFNCVLANGTYLLSPFAADATDAKTRAFVSAYSDAYGSSDPSQFAADAYDCVMIVADLIQKGGVTPDMSSSDMCNILKTAITSDFSYDGLTGTGMTWAPDGSVSKDPKAIIIKDCAYTSANQ